MNGSRSRNSEGIVSMSLTELLLLVAFLFLVVLSLYYRDVKAGEDVRANAAQIAQSVAKAAQAAEIVEEKLLGNPHEERMTDDVATQAEQAAETLEALVELAEDEQVSEILEETPMPEIWSELHRIKGDLDAATAINKVLMAEMDKTGALAKEMETLRRNVQKAEKNAEQARDKADRLKAEIMRRDKLVAASGYQSTDRLAEGVETMKGQMAYLRRQAGVGDPACWTTKDGRFEYLYHISIHDDGFVIRKAWPAHRSGQLEEIGAPKLKSPSRKLSPEIFRKLMAPLWAYGRAHNKCRFFVEVVDRTSPVSKEAWQGNLQLVEDVFYKKVVRK